MPRNDLSVAELPHDALGQMRSRETRFAGQPSKVYHYLVKRPRLTVINITVEVHVLNNQTSKINSVRFGRLVPSERGKTLARDISSV